MKNNWPKYNKLEGIMNSSKVLIYGHMYREQMSILLKIYPQFLVTGMRQQLFKDCKWHA